MHGSRWPGCRAQRVRRSCSPPTREQIVRPLDEYVRLEEASREDLSPVTFFDRVLEREIERKDERRIVTSLKLTDCRWARR